MLLRLPVVVDEPERPRVRGDCIDGPRPCPWVGCRHNLYLDELPNGKLRFTYPGEPHEAPNSLCSLDVEEGLSLRIIGEWLKLAHHEVLHLEHTAFRKIEAQSRNVDGLRAFRDWVHKEGHWDALDLMGDSES